MTKQNPPHFDSAIEFLNQGKIVIYPTETLYGMGVDALNPKAVEFLFQIKKRSLNKALPVLLSHPRDVQTYCKNISPVAQKLINEFWPGALTIILKTDAFPPGVAQNGTVGFRVSSHPLVHYLLKEFKKPLTTTSANISDKPSPENPMDFFKIFPKDSFILIQDQEKRKASLPSTVIDCTQDHYKILREGAVSKGEIDEVLDAQY